MGKGTRSVRDYRGRVVVLNLWATWCGPCKDELPQLERLHRQLAARGVTVVGVSVDAGARSDVVVRDVVRRSGITYDVLHDPTGAVQRAYRAMGVPTTVLIDRHGVVRRQVLGPFRWDDAATRSAGAALLAGKTP